ncbi:MAG: undecaprenyldiphospho-muramoylpentapeptide beta-N-acetylglucosaminyltransferase [Ignavibacteriales bacterium]|nr:undecaprenyldiphospho-muramoylpentapeptide beta-N-acetylglucosaminyltransferase [Ignavibacteriales bacterium]
MKRDTHLKFLFAGGGTGGHLFPALAIADEIKKLAPDAEILFAGTKGKIEARVVPQRGYAFETIWISGLHRRLTFDNLLFPIKVVVALVQSFFLIKKFQPDVVVGTGGYVCGPILYVASLLRISTIVHESNSYPGITTRILAGRATKVYIAFESTKRWLKNTSNVELVGTPTRDTLGSVSKERGREFFKLDPAKKTVLVFGGSLGAASINTAVLNLLDEIVATDIQLIWQTGQTDYERINKAASEKQIGWIGAFIDKMEYAFAAADLVICRSGATTLAELTRIGMPAILVPYPHAAADHQTHNAKSLADAGAATMIKDGEVFLKLKSALLELLNNKEQLARMSEASLKLGKPQAGREIAIRVVELAVIE